MSERGKLGNGLIAAAVAVTYWMLYAWANSMIAYYPSSVLPLLTATKTPNPYFFVHSGSFFAYYNSGIQWALNGNIMFILLAGNLLFSLLISCLASRNVSLALRCSYKGVLKEEGIRHIAFLAIAVAVLSMLMPLAAIPLLFIPTNASTIPLQVWVTDYALESNTATVILLLLLIPLWNRIYSSARHSDSVISATV